MEGNWTIQIEDGTHAIHADITSDLLSAKLKVTWDGDVVESCRLMLLLGPIKPFQRAGHSFVFRIHGYGLLGTLALLMDGAELPSSGVARPLPKVSVIPTPAPIQFVKELSVQESEEVVGMEEYPLDNRFGDQAFTTVHQVARESTNELSIDTSSQLGGKLGLEVFSAIKAEIEAQVSHQTGQKIGEKLTESQTLTFSVGPKSSVLYQVVWKRKIRSGERLYLSGGNSVTVPYRVNYGLSCEVRTRANTACD
ncbi:MAG: hypothetical protein ABSC76_05895 [Terracidiphilus sp.]|jgi:hypothetical protein